MYDQSCLNGPVTATAATDPDSPPVGTLFFYLVARRDACGDSIAGHNSAGVPIPTASPCSGSGVDSDGDGFTDAVDNCSLLFNPLQEDTNGNGIGDACEGGE